MRQDSQVVERGAPQHGLLATGVHRDVAADAGGLGRGRVDGKHISGALGRVGHALVTTPASVQIVATGRSMPGSATHLDTSVMVSSFSVLMTALFQVSGQCAAGVAGAAAARDDGQAQIDAALDQPGHLGLGAPRWKSSGGIR
jgi:hypothetical protein